MAETTTESDMGIGLGLLFGGIAILAAAAMGGTAYATTLSENADTMQLLSGVALAVAMLAGGLSITAIHIYE